MSRSSAGTYLDGDKYSWNSSLTSGARKDLPARRVDRIRCGPRIVRFDERTTGDDQSAMEFVHIERTDITSPVVDVTQE